MNKQLKKSLYEFYESIMKLVSIIVKNALNEEYSSDELTSYLIEISDCEDLYSFISFYISEYMYSYDFDDMTTIEAVNTIYSDIDRRFPKVIMLADNYNEELTSIILLVILDITSKY